MRGQEEELSASDTGPAARTDMSSSLQPASDVYCTSTTGPEVTGRRITSRGQSDDGNSTVQGSRSIESRTTPGQTDEPSQLDVSSQGQTDASSSGRPQRNRKKPNFLVVGDPKHPRFNRYQ